MKIYTETFPIEFEPIAHPDAVISVGDARFTILTDRVIRVEYDPAQKFTDQPSQVFWYRYQSVPLFTTKEVGGTITIETEYLILRYTPTKSPFRPTIEHKTTGETWQYGQIPDHNLLGTYRTLDTIDGAVPLESGILTRGTFTLIDDSDSLVFTEDGWLTPRPKAIVDGYVFGYAQHHKEALDAYFSLTGRVPKIPRWALGNWWSRYWAYTADELLALMREFQSKDVPLSVCIVDMDWHITETNNESTGWTGYTWNRELFPDPEGFIHALHEMGLKTALNLHPADGVHSHEAQYEAFAKHLGVDPKTNTPIPFDIANPDFTQAYFELLHHPHEDKGVDFWWTDWQQGTISGMPGLDPLFWLNHLHFYDLGREQKKRPFVFSRWGGLGNHRYPIGFSGDTVVTWDSLAFQPYFTATAANVGYGWWSHDIGGHMGGFENAELYLRWLQYGVFSPILRLHSSKNPFHERRTWGFDAETEILGRQAMQLRHALIPYLYTEGYRYHKEGQAPIRPMYHDHPSDERAYNAQDQYTFGSELIAAPYTAPRDKETGLSRQVIWFPAGDWYHLFSGLHYVGDTHRAVYGAMDDIPVFAKAGALIPMAKRAGWQTPDNPKTLEIHAFPGATNQYELYEDDGGDTERILPFASEWGETEWKLQALPVSGTTAHIPKQRTIQWRLRAVQPDIRVSIAVNGQKITTTHTYEAETRTLVISDIQLSPTDTFTLYVYPGTNGIRDHAPRLPQRLTRMIREFHADTWLKGGIGQALPTILKNPTLLSDYSLTLTDAQFQALIETILPVGFHQFKDLRTEETKIIVWNQAQEVDLKMQWGAFKPMQIAQNKQNIPPFGMFTIGNSISYTEDTTMTNARDNTYFSINWRLDLHFGARTLSIQS